MSLQDLENAQESPANSAYSRYILDIGVQGDVTELLVAVFSCLLGYGEVGLFLQRKLEDGSGEVILEGNRYKRWIQDYSGAEFQNAVKRGIRGSACRYSSTWLTFLRLQKRLKSV